MNTQFVRPLLLGSTLAVGFPLQSFAAFLDGASVTFAPPALPQYAQPPCPDAGYLWTPGYWAYSQDQEQYYWVPGNWVLAPTLGFLWTPGYWSNGGSQFVWHAGYWASHVGFYGGINYGFGYSGVGFEGGYWHGRSFYYNRAVTNITNRHITNVYNKTINESLVYNSRISFNRVHGVRARAPIAEVSALRQSHHALPAIQKQNHFVTRYELHPTERPPKAEFIPRRVGYERSQPVRVTPSRPSSLHQHTKA